MKNFFTRLSTISLVALALIITSYFVLQSSLPKEKATTPSENVYTPGELTGMLSLGFTNSKPVYEVADYDAVFNSSKVKYYKDTYGLVYFSEQGLQNICNKHNLIMGQPSLYIGNIPKDAAHSMTINAAKILGEDIKHDEQEKAKAVARLRELKKQKVSGDEHYISNITFTSSSFSRSSNEGGMWVALSPPSNVLIIAPKDHFNMDNTVEVNRKLEYRDPIVVRKVHDGYVQLARW